MEAIVEVGEARVMGGWTMTPAARTSEVVNLVGCEVRLNEVNSKRGFDGNFVEEDPAMPVFWKMAEALGLAVEGLSGETERDVGCEGGLSLMLDLVALGAWEEHGKEYEGWFACEEQLEVGAGVGVGFRSDAEEARWDVSSTESIL